MVTEDILVKYLAGEAEEHEVAMIEQWRKLSIDNEKHYQQLVKLWNHAGNLGQEEKLDVESAWSKVNGKIHSGSRTRVVWFGRPWMAIAAGIVLFLGVALWLFVQKPGQENLIAASTVGEKLDINLKDGSKITLLDGQIEYPETFQGRSRRIILKSGKAYFDVERDTNRRFEIQCGNSMVTVLGTEFEIEFNEKHTRVIVNEGKVQFETEAGTSVLIAGMSAEYFHASRNLNTKSGGDLNELVYKTGMLGYDSEDILSVITDIRKFAGNVEIEVDPRIANCKISGKFNLNDGVKTVLELIAYTLQAELKVSESGHAFRLEGGVCGND